VRERAREYARAGGRGGLPALTLAWAQSLDGAITRRRGRPTALSGPESSELTHALRSFHAAILAGVGTILADDPLLSVRLVSGPQPTPVILDSRLRTPPTARILSRPEVRTWIFHAGAPAQAARPLSDAGARLFSVPRSGAGLDLRAVLRALAAEGMGSVMVEGGAEVLRAFLASGLPAAVAVTLAPVLTGGLTLSGPGEALLGGEGEEVPRLRDPAWELHGRDMVVWGELGT
jgi:riboflavin-specific deaminase-like protein